MSKPIGKKHISSTLKNMKKGLDGSESGKLTLLAEIRSLLRRLENWRDDCLALATICRFLPFQLSKNNLKDFGLDIVMKKFPEILIIMIDCGRQYSKLRICKILI
ncbi:uncharacterized protein OCT59_009199 [Rhizophagus irregularis]|uniref:uncharacterized protein n=1 Tax=Rhizophagus irregularis TaxID=588596 RepID=UPI001A0969C7|nr:hypothetical protein OCT59_009199 [Rhizophagus irregularis]GET59343.1 hypothetical protein GLOIN_2v1774607 [Rhizophagus irregularis DAOM 181602=DAOM 197198]